MSSQENIVKLTLKPKRRYQKSGIESFPAQFLLVALLLFSTFLVILPVLVTVMLSLKPNADFVERNIWAFPSKFLWKNYSYAFTEILDNLVNTLLIDFASTICVTILSAYVAYVFVRLDFPLKNFLFYCIIIPTLCPGIVYLTAQYINIVNMGLLGSYWSLFFPYLAGNQIGSIFLYRTFMGQQPAEIYEAAKIDGAGHFKTFFYICLPLSVAVLMVQSIGIFSAIYNDYLWPMMMFVGNTSKSTLMPMLNELATRAGSESKGASYALYLISGIPLIIATAISLKFSISGEFAAGLKF
jgi:ABC-type glycerol-3-phosphate transport system permease component